MISFKPLFRMACNLPVALNTDTRSIAFRYFDLFTESTLFLTSYFIVSKWWLVRKWNNFFSARHQLDSEGEVATSRS